MKKEQLLKLGIKEDLVQKVMDIFREELKGYIPKSRFDQVNEAKKELEKKVTILEKEFEELDSMKFKLNELEKTIWNFWRASLDVGKKQEEIIKDYLILIMIRDRLVNKDYTDLLTSKIDKSSISVTPEGTLSGMEEQLSELKRDYEGMFLNR